MRLKTLDTAALIPSLWATPDRGGGVWHPSIVRHGQQTVQACLAPHPDGEHRIALCRIGADMNVVAGSAQPTADHPAFATLDAAPTAPRLVSLHGTLYLVFEVAAPPSGNRIHMVAIDPDTLLPAAPMRDVVTTGHRRQCEQGWLFFEHGADVFVISDLAPLTILRADLSQQGRVICEPYARHAWDAAAYADVYGPLRGGSSPVRRNGSFYLFARSVFTAEPDPAAGAAQSVAVGAALVLSARPPFLPELHSARPILAVLPAEQAACRGTTPDRRSLEAACPAGAAGDADGLTVSYGVNGHHAALRRFAWSDIHDSLVPAIHRSAGPARPATPAPATDPSGTRACLPETHSLRAFWWRSARRSARVHPNAPEPDPTRFVHGNFGDLAGPPLLERLTGLTPRHDEDGPRLLTVGSVLQMARDGDVIWGTGINGAHPEFHFAPRNLQVYATRGPISCDILRRAGHDVSRVTQMFDPVSLIGHLFAAEIDAMRRLAAEGTRNIIVIPHFRDVAVMQRLYPQYADRIHSPDTPFFEMVGAILRADLVVSSSLHGIVVADALGVPSVWHRPVMGEDELKFIDYYLATGRARIVKVDSLHDAFRASPMPLPVFDHAAMLASFPPPAALEAHGVLVPRTPLEVGRTVAFSVALPDNVALLSGWSVREAHGVWTDGEVATMDAFVGHPVGEDMLVELCLSAYVPSPDHPQRVELSGPDGVIGSFEITHGRPVAYRFALDPDSLVDGVLHLTFTIPTAVSPASVSDSGDGRRLGIALASLRVRPRIIATTPEPELRVMVGSACHKPVEVTDHCYRFVLPKVDQPVTLVSRKAQPGDIREAPPGLATEDRRRLGVGVRGITIERDEVVTPIPIDHPGLDNGWWGIEGQNGHRWRWTNGNAALPVARGGPTTIDVTISHTTAYPLDQ